MNTGIAKKRSESITIFVGNLADETREEDLRSLFGQYGTVSAIRLVSGSSNRRHDSCCYLTMRGRPAKAAISGLDGKAFRGSILRVTEAQAHPEGTDKLQRAPPGERVSNATRLCYQVASVEKAEVSPATEGGDWYRYVLSSGSSQITGFHRGSLADVQEYATNCVEEFNLRSIRGKSKRPMAPPRKK